MIEMGVCEVGCIAKHLADWSSDDTVSIKKSLPLNFRHLSLEGVRRPLIEYVDANTDFPPLSELTKKTKGEDGIKREGGEG
jgi:hypothetical protein